MDTAAPAAPGTFQRQVTDSLSDMSGPDAADYITRLHDADVRAMQSRLQAAREEAAGAVAAATQKNYLLAGVSETAARETHRAAGQFARAELGAQLLRKLGALAQEAEDGKVAAADILAILATPMAPIPYRAHIAAFHPSQQYTSGRFASDDGAVHQVYPFVGWSLIVEVPSARGADRLAPSFLVDDEIRTAQSLLEERGIKLTQLT